MARLEFLERRANVNMMLIDFAMPGMSGAEVARRAHMTRPALPILFVTGYADRAALEGVSNAQIIGKPFRYRAARKGAHRLGPTGAGQGRAPAAVLSPGRKLAQRNADTRRRWWGGATESPEQTSKSHVTSCLRRYAARERWRGVGLAGSGCVQQTVA